ncbi:hypothetical protein COW36_08670 [bacterium (Candidatus Blackallbacteria) CG17_big_fil_post_rev_8_21_14_2_50_48_46]|uniref:TVP38/TMEM64 family membrane protein n=1 Tax=bacterium (Candidatus Blackallbacteria) CG17_big_fil_post_rev_8_21_14_2_50_48_46 TaxID=2014261 RepID=A0A2M7G6I8_9BACT|nr:MAG: hypothetical protein COW64_05970 [bacterium (Candidatus Blackallbacteria) CG18_big_fil_WC_8_21_14_2_50_49_26]PIW17559.1 MAG: hypothetical protein COW36_08670 [bacterium (Candidatus Blackallbacteria) CG17_big_fil_post_rev_8_21_14_2_50_48_46]PIW48414.1 MAG: hypothetical protein COW20_10020 [bacterium (Candidatus Blackallbacteria) CG13_big_fil_rev_8_21_14_2_50_49_14]
MIPLLGLALGIMLVFSWAGQFVLPMLPKAFQIFLQELIRGNFHASFNTLQSFFQGPTGMGAFILLQALQVVIAPIPGQLMGLMGGALFGFWKGLLFSSLGLGLGSLLTMLLGRLGGKLLRKFLPQKLLNNWLPLLEKGGVMTYFLIFLLPAFPDDALCLLAGLTRLPLKDLFWASLLGRLPGLVLLCLAGTQFESDPLWVYWGGGLLGGLSVLIWIFQEEIESHLRKHWLRA